MYARVQLKTITITWFILYTFLLEEVQIIHNISLHIF